MFIILNQCKGVEIDKKIKRRKGMINYDQRRQVNIFTKSCKMANYGKLKIILNPRKLETERRLSDAIDVKN